MRATSDDGNPMRATPSSESANATNSAAMARFTIGLAEKRASPDAPKSAAVRTPSPVKLAMIPSA